MGGGVLSGAGVDRGSGRVDYNVADVAAVVRWAEAGRVGLSVRQGWPASPRHPSRGHGVGVHLGAVVEAGPPSAERQLHFPSDDNYVAPSVPRLLTGTWPSRSSA